MATIRLDDLYCMVANIYGEQNALRPVSATLAHFVEVCGMLTIHDRKKRDVIEVEDALCKALGWYFPLLAKLNVRSVEEIIYRKYPYACPYCRLKPHRDMECKTVRGTATTVNHDALRSMYENNKAVRPRGLDEWQNMFQEIYPRSADDKGRSTLGLFEELGELAEAVRVFERYPKYFAGEAADTFSYLMGIANEYSVRKAQESGYEFSLEKEFLKRYPGLCVQCGYRVCICPAIPRATVGRMSKELDISFGENLFSESHDNFAARGRAASAAVVDMLGGYGKLAEKFPIDRGDANRALVLLFLKLARAVEKSRPQLAEQLHAAAIEVGTAVTEAGSPGKDQGLDALGDLLDVLRTTLRDLDPAEASSLNDDPSSLLSELGKSLSKLRVLFVYASPTGALPLRVANELRAIRESIASSGRQGEIELDDLPAARVDDLRRRLLSAQYEIIHFAGHGSAAGIVLENELGSALEVPIQALSEYLGKHGALKCLILNACDSLSHVPDAIAAVTIGMEAAVDDDAAVEFARGFYDALSRGKAVASAIEEGKSAAVLKGLPAPPLKVLMKNT